MRRGLVCWSVVSLVVVAVLASALAFAQAKPEPRVLSGSDIGFRIEGMNRAGLPMGTLVVRIDGKWVETVPSPSFNRIN
jgi:hypothetical protein